MSEQNLDKSREAAYGTPSGAAPHPVGRPHDTGGLLQMGQRIQGEAEKQSKAVHTQPGHEVLQSVGINVAREQGGDHSHDHKPQKNHDADGQASFESAGPCDGRRSNGGREDRAENQTHPEHGS
jgi:hypothetical protein